MGKVDLSLALRYYKRSSVQEELIKHAVHKEIGLRFEDKFGKRPDILTYPNEVVELAKRGLTSLHCSEELWEYPLQINPKLTKKEMGELRIGWDLVLDIDCAFLDYSKICADLVVKFLKYTGVEDIFCKFSGNKGFHIAVPFEAFPETIVGEQTRDKFPEAPRKIAFYIKENIKYELSRRVLEFECGDFGKIKEKTGLEYDKLVRSEKNQYGDIVKKLEVENFLEIDTVLISSRHLFRMPYSLHEKSGLMSLPIDPDRVMEFEKPMADPDKFFEPIAPFLDRNVKSQSGRNLLVQAYDFKVKTRSQRVVDELKEELKRKATNEDIIIESAIREDLFPPCMQIILKGLEDGKKRAVFAMINFLSKVGWTKQEVTSYLMKWNKANNPEPLRDNYILGQLRYFAKGGRLPPNCDNEAYYTGLHICQPDGLCKKIKNPVNYTIIKWKMLKELKEKEEKIKAKELQKEVRKRKKEESEKKKVEKEAAKNELEEKANSESDVVNGNNKINFND
ncbi:hypothetical protein HN385_02030 [archaeon]|nr:hypothetical protein [archaeon]MBT3450332.1 hypothetical protein [archaeon]MBT6868893.1 hypothetical protein [archaeon]MBT7192886.1 hypothetical protein [archaeon]MBT7380852.1 hypothetical protein [archaeon]